MSFSIRSLWRGATTPATARERARQLVDEGVAAERSGNPERSRARFEAAIDADASFADAHMNLGIALNLAGRAEEAIACQERAIALDPALAAAHCNLALARFARREFSLAEKAFRVALERREDLMEAWVGLAGTLEAMGRDEEALSALERAVGSRPDHTGALDNMGALLRKLGRAEAATSIDRRLLEIEPENAIVHHRLGSSLHDQGRLAEAEAAYKRSLALAPDHGEAAAGLGRLLSESGRTLDALPWLFQAVAAFPAVSWLKRMLAESLVGIELGTADAGVREREVLRRLCLDDEIATLFLAVPIVALVKRHPGFGTLARAAEARAPLPADDEAVRKLLCDPLLLAILPRIALMEVAVERVLTYVRRAVLLDSPDGVPPEFVCALARQCFFSSYAYLADDDELREVARIRANLERELRDIDASSGSIETRLARFALYESLRALQGSERLLDGSRTQWSESFAPLVAEQLADRQLERELSSRLAAVTPIEDEVSVAVRAMYEENPYPRWVTSPNPAPEPYESLWHRLHGQPPEFACARPVPMLVAGCGTGRHAIQVARRNPEAAVLAVDLSRASLGYAARMTTKLGIANIEYCQGDILKLSALGRRFALIESGGVLHHLRDPMAGWRVLRGLLEPFGLMKIALYSEKARASVRSARELVAALQLPATAEGLRAGRRAIMALPQGHPAASVMSFFDFYTLDEFRDLAFHVQEHQFTLPQIARCLDQLDLRLLLLEVTSRTRSRFTEMFPAADAKTDLAAWDLFEDVNPDTFASMYSFWCCPR